VALLVWLLIFRKLGHKDEEYSVVSADETTYTVP
jgi:hypothetical protein